jgi:LysM repeat protein
MSRISTTLARVLAVLALAAVALAIFLVVSSSIEDDDDGGKGKPAVQRQNNDNRDDNGNQNQGGPPKVYIVQPGDTLTGIAEETGVSIERIQQLNPGLDPQILNSGERLRLR